MINEIFNRTLIIVCNQIKLNLHSRRTFVELAKALPSFYSKMDGYRIPQNVIPHSYDLFIKPDLESGVFSGKTFIELNVKEETQEIKIHCKNLDISNVTFDGKKVTYSENTIYEYLIITNDDGSTFKPGNKHLSIEYSGKMLDKIVGIYRSVYKDSKGNNRSISTTKFEPTYARQAFPCFDEPNMKATYKFHILKPKSDQSYIALSNMPVEREERMEDGILVHFENSMKMSTYLACFIVCDFNYTETSFGLENKPLKVYSTPAQVDKTQFAKYVAKGVVEYLTDYFQIPYPLPKLDLVAIPDYVSGATEHWGVITFRETALLYDNETSTNVNKQRVAVVVAHELCHSWFGNLVTTDWWDDLWLNEGFASYLEYKGVDAIFPEWQMMSQFLILDLHPVLSYDSKLSSHPIIQIVNTPDEITSLFDVISYNKGASILRMLEDVLGEETFRKGITNFLNQYKWSTAVSQNLWDRLQDVVTDRNFNVTSFMDTWTVQMGYPVVNVTIAGDKYVLKQQRFLADPDAKFDPNTSIYKYKWTIPVTYITSENSKPKRIWFNYNDDNVTIPVDDKTTWIKFNYNQTGYYRVNYERGLWDDLVKNFDSFNVTDKTHLLEESFSLADANLLDYSVPLSLTKYLKNETNYIPWDVVSNVLKRLKNYLTDSLQYSNLLDFAIDLTNPVYEKLTWHENSNDSHLDKEARATVLSLACSMGHEGCLSEGKKLFDNWLSEPSRKNFSQDLKPIVYNYGAISATAEQWNEMFKIFANETDANEKVRLMAGLTAVKEPWILKKLLILAEDETYIRNQDYVSLIVFISNNPVGTPIVWDYVRSNWEKLVDRFTLNNRYFGAMIPAITKSFLSTTKLNEMKQFFEQYPNAGSGERYRLQALETVQNNIKWLERNKETIEKWLENYQKL